MSKKLYSNTEFSISIESVDKRREIFKEWNDFVIENQGIYTIEGENQSGKSLLIKMIMEALPKVAIEGNKRNVIIDGDSVLIQSLRDAKMYGLQAVFQDDNLIPTMTVKEQIELKYLPHRGIKEYFFFFWNYLIKLLEHPLSLFSTLKFVNNLFKSISFDNDKVFPERKVLMETDKYFTIFGLTNEVLDKYPNQLSGGTKARVRIAVSFLSPKLLILFLDEALNAIDKESKPEIIDNIKNLAKEKKITLVIVTHDEQEIYRWQPIGRFIIKNQKLEYTGLDYFDGLYTSININKSFIAKFNSFEKAKHYFEKEKGKLEPYIFLVDKNVKDSDITKEIFHFLKSSETDSNCFFLELDETKKNIDTYKKVLIEILAKSPKNEGTFIIIGGGILINIGLFITGTINRGLGKHIIIPTTVMAIADVAIGSKASLNVNEKSINPKHKIGLYSNPIAIICEQRFIETLSSKEIKIGLSECLKHGILQSESLFYDVLTLLKETPIISQEQVFDLSIKTRDLKGETLIIDPFEREYSIILLFGHLHAHCIESLSNFQIPHGISVYFGIFIDLEISNKINIIDELKFILSDNDLKEYFVLLKRTIETEGFKKLDLIYNNDIKDQFYTSPSKYKIIEIERIGCYSTSLNQVKIKKIDWNRIKKAIENILKYID